MPNRMTVIKSRLISATPGYVRMRCTFEVSNGWFVRFLWKIPKTTQLTDIYEQVGGVWRCYGFSSKLPPKFSSELNAIAERLLAESEREVVT